MNCSLVLCISLVLVPKCQYCSTVPWTPLKTWLLCKWRNVLCRHTWTNGCWKKLSDFTDISLPIIEKLVSYVTLFTFYNVTVHYSNLCLVCNALALSKITPSHVPSLPNPSFAPTPKLLSFGFNKVIRGFNQKTNCKIHNLKWSTMPLNF